MHLHLLATAIYTIDLIRMYSHPHCWFFNCPVLFSLLHLPFLQFIAWYMADRIYGIFWYRRHTAVVVKKLEFDKDYMLLFLRLPPKVRQRMGDLYYLNLLDVGWDRAHPFSSFANHAKTAKVVEDHEIELRPKTTPSLSHPKNTA